MVFEIWKKDLDSQKFELVESGFSSKFTASIEYWKYNDLFSELNCVLEIREIL